jgi:hypothetical protein
MTPATPTVQVERVPEFNALKLIWRVPVHRADAALAAEALLQDLEEIEGEFFLLVELAGDALIPTSVKISDVLREVCRHPQLAGILIYGQDSSARIISRRLTLLTTQVFIRAFSSEYDALSFLETHQLSN